MKFENEYNKVIITESHFDPTNQLRSAIAALKALSKNYKADGDKDSSKFYDELITQINNRG